MIPKKEGSVKKGGVLLTLELLKARFVKYIKKNMLRE